LSDNLIVSFWGSVTKVIQISSLIEGKKIKKKNHGNIENGWYRYEIFTTI